MTCKSTFQFRLSTKLLYHCSMSQVHEATPAYWCNKSTQL